jgi:hypothetical protein
MKKQILILATIVLMVANSLSARAQGVSFLAILSGDDEVPANASPARGIALFRVDDDGSTVHFTLLVANIQNAVAAHIHTAAVGVNGPVVVPLFSGPAGGGRVQGILAEGTFTATEELLETMAAGGTYVNVHTNDGVDPANTGPSDLPGGEIRGQVFVVGDVDTD